MRRSLAFAATVCAALGAGAPPASALTPEGDVLALVIDTGINAEHQEFGPGQIVGFWDFADPGLLPTAGQFFDPRKAPFDPNGHGTATSAMVGARGISPEQTPSAAPGVKLAMAKVGDDEGAITGDIAAAIRWGTEVLHADAINISIGTIVPTGPASPLVLSADEYAALHEARAAGVLTAVANGNGTGNLGLVPGDGASSGSSSSLDVLAVGASGLDGPTVSQNPEVAAQFSVRTPTPEGRDTYRDISGTSFSSPFTLGFVARLMQELAKEGRSLPVADLETLVKGVATDTAIPPVSEGYGVIDLSVLPTALGHIRAGTLPVRPSPDLSGSYVEGVAGTIRALNNAVVPGTYVDPGAAAASPRRVSAPTAAQPAATATAMAAAAGSAPGAQAPGAAGGGAVTTKSQLAPVAQSTAAGAKATGTPKLGAPRALRGASLRLRGTVDRPAALTVTLRRGGKLVRRVRATRASAGSYTVALGKRPAPGRYVITVRAATRTGSATRTLRVTVR